LLLLEPFLLCYSLSCNWTLTTLLTFKAAFGSLEFFLII
jgi:hypothetical protein